MNFLNASVTTLSFGSTSIPIVIIDVDDVVYNSVNNLYYEGTLLTRQTLSSVLLPFILNKPLAGGIRINLSSSQGLFPTTSIVEDNLTLAITNRNSATVVATELSFRVSTGTTYYGATGTDCRGYGSFVYAPLIFYRENQDNDKFIMSSTSIIPCMYTASAGLVLDTSNAFPVFVLDSSCAVGGSTGSYSFTPYGNFSLSVASGDTDPYAPGGASAPSQATGNFDLSSDSVDFPTLPTLTAVSTGLVTIYTPDLQQINSLATYLWNADPTTVDWWKKLVANPLDLILGLSIVPVAVPTSGPDSVKVGLIDTQVTMNKASTQFVEVPCGSINITEFYGGALDYSPYRKTSIYLPFIGTRLLSTDDIMGKTVEVKYHVDLLSGALVALVKCGDAVLYQFAGACAVSLPLSGQTFTDTILSTIQLAAAGTAFVATGGFGLTGGAAVASAAGGGAALASNVMTSKPTIERAGGVSGAAGQLGIMTPYLIGEIPRQSVPENYNTFVGYPSNIKSTLGDLTGFTSVESIHLQNIPATAAEYAEIEQLLKEGVIL